MLSSLDENTLYCYVLHNLTYLFSKLQFSIIFVKFITPHHLSVSQFAAKCINTLHAGADIHCMAHSFAFCDRLLRDLIPTLLLILPIRDFS